LLPESRLATLMADLFGVKVAAATIARMSRTCAERLQVFVETVRNLVAGAPVKHDDIRLLARWLAEADPLVLAPGNGIERGRNGGSGVRAAIALPVLMGKLDARTASCSAPVSHLPRRPPS
jgi:anaerobic selenocysteine-containing dehydrogenase